MDTVLTFLSFHKSYLGEHCGRYWSAATRLSWATTTICPFFASLKSFLQAVFYSAIRRKSALNVFVVEVCIGNAHFRAFTIPNIKKMVSFAVDYGILKGAIQHIGRFDRVFSLHEDCDSISLSELLEPFGWREVSLLRDVDIGYQGRIYADTAPGAHLMNEMTLDVVKSRK